MSTRRSILRASLLLACLFAAPPASAKLPDWAGSLADSAPPIPSGVPDTPTRILLSEVAYTIQPDGTLLTRRRLAVQALSVSAADVDSGLFHFDETARVTASRAWHLPPGDTARKSRSAPIDVTVGENFLTGSKARILHVADIKKGSLVFFQFEATEKPYTLSLMNYFYESAPVAVMRVQVEAPEGWTVRAAWLRKKGPDPAATAATRTWEMRDLPPPVDEPLGVPEIDRAPLLVVGVVPPAGTAVAPAVFPDWPAFSRWYTELAKGRNEASPAIQEAAKQAAAASAEGLLDRVRAEAILVRDRVRYVDVELGVGAFQPRPAQETLANLYGDCKDKGTLYQALLSAESIPSYPILVNATLPETVSGEVPTWGFNHLVVGVPLPEELQVPADYAAAVADAGDLGRLLVVDTTDEYASFGTLSSELAGRRALVAAGPKGNLITLPQGKPEYHRVDRKLAEDLQADGSLSVERESLLMGEPAAMARRDARRSSEQRRKRVEGEIIRSWPDAAVLEYSTVLESPDGRFQEKMKYRRPALSRQGNLRSVELFPGASEDVERVPLTRRKTAVEYGYPRTIRYETLLKGIPEAVSLPEPQTLQGEGWAVATSYARDGKDVKATWELRLERTRFEPAAFPELRKLWSAVGSTAGWMLELPG
jgi:uncharacterized protein DUF3857